MIIDGRYELDPSSRLRGGMGEIWFGYDKRLDRPIAMKFIRIDQLPDGKPDPELTRRFVRESRITARLEHPGVPTVYDCGTQGEDLYLVMQLIKGRSIADIMMESGTVPVPWAAAIAAQACSVLAVAHANSLVHRDLKPGNLMLCRDGSVKVLDFGVAAALSPTATRLTRSGVVVGTPEYMAPEQALCGTTSPQSDLYSLGVVLDEMLTGRNQFASPTAPASIRNHLYHDPHLPDLASGRVPEILERLLTRLLAKTPKDRPPSAEAVYRVLVQFCDDLPPFPDYVDAEALHPVRMYATVLGRVRSPAKLERPVSPMPSLFANKSVIGHNDIVLAHENADILRAEPRFSQAAEVLAEVVAPATEAWEAKIAEVMQLRIELADMLFFGGDYRRAAHEFAKLAADLMEIEGADHDLVLRFRLMEASCHAAVGETSLAFAQLGLLLDDEARPGVEEDHILESRYQIGPPGLGSGDRSKARQTLSDLLSDLEARYGSAYPRGWNTEGVLGEPGDKR